jgi:RNA polymerase sigma-70 factor (ECF subfamily)
VEQSDDELVLAAREGDADAAETLVRRHARRLSAHLYRLTGSVHDSEDLMQETFARFFGALDHYRPEGHLKAYLTRIASNLAAHARDAARQRDTALGDDLAARTPGPDAVAAGRELSHALRDGLHKLPEEQREALLLRTYDGHDYETIARLTGASVSAVKVRVFRARETLRPLVAGAKEAAR